jgi:hypothetical protein
MLGRTNLNTLQELEEFLLVHVDLLYDSTFVPTRASLRDSTMMFRVQDIERDVEGLLEKIIK